MTNASSQSPSTGATPEGRCLHAGDARLERLHLWVENSRDVVAEVTLQGRIVYVSPNVKSVLGYEPAELVGTSLFAHVHPDDMPSVHAQFLRPEGWVTSRYRHQDGSWRWVEASGRDFLAGDGEERVWIIARDVTGHKWAEDERRELLTQLRQAQKLELLGTLAGGIAHDFNNLLTAIMVSAELAQGEADGRPDLRRHLSQVLAASERGKGLVRQILTFSREHNSERRPLALTTVIGEVVRLLRPTLPAGVELRADVRDRSSLVFADPTQVHQVLMNLCTNAAYALGGRRGRIEVRLDAVGVDALYARTQPRLPPGRYVRLVVADNGAGMDAATLKRIFDPFFTTKPPGEGTGLGLAVVNRIVRDHDGAIHVSSRPGEGTTFEVFFRHHGTAAARPDELPPSMPGQGERVLLVGHDAVEGATTATLLRKLNYIVVFRTCSREALAAFRAEPAAFDLVIADVDLPELSGADLAAAVREIRPAVPILLSGASVDQALRAQLRARGVADFVRKPIVPAALAETLRRALRAVPATAADFPAVPPPPPPPPFSSK